MSYESFCLVYKASKVSSFEPGYQIRFMLAVVTAQFGDEDTKTPWIHMHD